jgi:hypothetical protein
MLKSHLKYKFFEKKKYKYKIFLILKYFLNYIFYYKP